MQAAQGNDADSGASAGVNDGDEAKEPLVPVETATVPKEEYDRLKTERDLLFDRLARLQADVENSRKRETRERTEFRDFAVSNAVEQFLPVLDNFQLALKSTGSTDQLRTGVELIVKQMEEALRSLNVQPVEIGGRNVRSTRARSPRNGGTEGSARSSGIRRGTPRLSDS